MNPRERSFTLMELIIVVVIIGVIAGFAVPGYQKAMKRQQVKRALVAAHLIAGAQDIYKAKHGRYWCGPCNGPYCDCATLANFNANLGLNIIPEAGIQYFTWVPLGRPPEKEFVVHIPFSPFLLVEVSRSPNQPGDNPDFPPLRAQCCGGSSYLYCPPGTVQIGNCVFY